MLRKGDKVRVPSSKEPANHETYFVDRFKENTDLVFICKVESKRECHYEPYDRLERVLL